VVAGNGARSRIWAISGGTDAIGLSYGPISIVLQLCFHGGSKEVSQNMGNTEAIWGGSTMVVLLR
jgi:hypothetical protein